MSDRKTVNFAPGTAGGTASREPFGAARNPNTISAQMLENQAQKLSKLKAEGIVPASFTGAPGSGPKLKATSRVTSDITATGGGGGGGAGSRHKRSESGGDKRKRHNRSSSSSGGGGRDKRSSSRSKHQQQDDDDDAAAEDENHCCDPVRACTYALSARLQAWWRRLMAIPTFFALWTYILPFTLEMTILALHFQELHSLPDGSLFIDWEHFPRRSGFIVAQMVFGILLSVKFLFGVLLTKSSWYRYLVSPFGLVSMLTLPMMIYPAIDYFAMASRKSLFASPWPAPYNESMLLRQKSFDVINQTFAKRSAQEPPAYLDLVVDDSITFTVPSVAAWRIWIVYDIMQTIIFASSTVSKSFRAIMFQLLFIFSLLFTCMGTMQLIFCIETNRFLDLGTSLYFTVVTLTTVGYGDFVPTSILGRAFIITQIFAAMLAIPVLLRESDRLVKFLDSLTGYSGSDRHIIVFGDLTQTEFELLLTERNRSDGSDDPLHVVFVAPSFTQDMHDFVHSLGSGAQYVTLCMAKTLSRSELLRFSPQRADAALFYSSSSAAALRGDYRTIAAAAAVKLHQPSLPQYLMLRRTSTAHLVEGAYVVFDRDFLRAALLGTSLQMPGFLPMFLNLIRLVPEKLVTKNPDEKKLRRRRRRHGNSAAGAGGGTTPRRGAGGAAAATGNKNHEPGGGGGASDSAADTAEDSARSSSSDDDDDDDATYAYHQLNRHGQKIKKKYRRKIPSNWYDLYLAGAKQNLYTITVPEVLVGRTFVVAAFIVQLRTGATPVGLVRDSKVALNAGATPLAASDSLVVIANSWEELYSRFSKFPTTSSAGHQTEVTKSALRAKEVNFETQTHSGVTAMWLASTHNCFPFQGHVILVDLASFLSTPELCPEERFQREQFQVQDLLALASRFPKWQSFVLLSLSPISDLMQAQWAASGRQPMFHVRKSPLDPEALKLCRIGNCMSVLVFSSLHLANTEDDTFQSAMLTVNRRVMDVVRAEMIEHTAKMKMNQQQRQHQGSGTFSSNNSSPSFGDPSGSGSNGNGKKNMTWPHPNVISVLGSPDEALLLSPEHRSFPGETLEHDAHCTAFATGGALCPTLLDGLLFRTYYNEYLPQIVELMLEPGAIKRERADQLAPALYEYAKDMANSSNKAEQQSDAQLLNSLRMGSAPINNTCEERGSGGAKKNNDAGRVTFGQLCRVMTAGKIICFGFSRVIDTPERGAETVGKVFFVTNPDLATPVEPGDFVFYLPTWSNEKLSKEFFS